MLSRIEALPPRERPTGTRAPTCDGACGLSVRSVDWRVLRDRRFASTVEKLWRGIESVRPDDRACLLIDTRLAEVLGIAEWLTQRAAKQKRAVDLADDTVVEDDSEAIAIERLHVCNSKHDLHFRAAARPEPAAQAAGRAPSFLRARPCATAPTGVRGATRAAEASRPGREVWRARSGRRPRHTGRGSAEADDPDARRRSLNRTLLLRTRCSVAVAVAAVRHTNSNARCRRVKDVAGPLRPVRNGGGSCVRGSVLAMAPVQ